MDMAPLLVSAGQSKARTCFVCVCVGGVMSQSCVVGPAWLKRLRDGEDASSGLAKPRRVKLARIPGRGLGLLARTGLSAGELILQEAPAMTVLAASARAQGRCGRCCRSACQPPEEPPRLCELCKQAWCSAACAREDARHHSALACGIVAAAASTALPYGPGALGAVCPPPG
jgi:hypothetical protein